MARPLERPSRSGGNVPVVTVVIPAYNAERYVSEALASVRGQMEDMEVLVVDDGSTDGTVKAAEAFAGAFDLTVLQQKNGGPSAARNIAIRRARGRYCAFLDADDLMLPGRLAAQVELLDQDPNLALVHTDLMTFDERGIIHRTRRAFSDPRGGMVLDRLLLDNFITTSTVMARTEHVIEAGLFNVKRPISHDFELWLQMAARWKIAFIDRPLAQYRYCAGSVSANKLASARDALDVIEAFWREHPEIRRNQPPLYRQSLAHHLAIVGTAALMNGRRGTAVAYLARSLARNPSTRRVWKSFVKAVIQPIRLPSKPSPPVGAVRSA
jgi:glycosyltransferase involved in cell wall biosynthesis